MITIVSPVWGSFDQDGDGLVDVEVHFHDYASGIDPSTLAIRSSRPIGPHGVHGTDLLLRFRLVARDSTRAVLEETPNALLPSGDTEIAVGITDRYGHRAVITRLIRLPPKVSASIARP